VWDFLNTVKSSDVVQSVYAWRKTSVEAKDLVVDKSCEREVVEKICEILPYVCIAILSKAFVIKSVDLCDLAGLVVSTEDGDALRITDFKGNEESNGFY
jgi:hypothetical protein